MTTRATIGFAVAALLLAAPAMSQDARGQSNGDATATSTAGSDSISAKAAATQPAIVIQHFRPQDQRGINIFEPPKEPGAPYTGFKLDWGAAFTQQFQALDHSNAADQSVEANQLIDITSGFNNATANLYLNAQLARGIRVQLSSYLSSRHHNEAWVKDGYLLVDASPIDVPALNTLMEYVTLRLGHFEINYGDAHFRRSDNGNAMYNPFVGNYILDSFTTEVGGEVYFRSNGLMAMFGVTGGEIRGQVKEGTAPAFLGKLGFDRQLNEDLRVRLTGSVYTTEKSLSNTLYSGDRAGSRYYFVLENAAASESSNFRSGLLVPGLTSEVTAFQVNPFVKFGGLELFGVIEKVEGRTRAELDDGAPKREWNQYAVDALYRFLPDDKLYVGARYNTVEGEMAGITNEVGADRYQIGGGWFITPSVLLKAEYVNQQYNDFPISNIFHKGKFDGFVVEGVVAF